MSRCCKKKAFEMVNYYACSTYHFPCDIVFTNHNQKEYDNDTRNANEIEGAFNQT